MATSEEAVQQATRLLGPTATPLLESDQFSWDDLVPLARTFDEAGLIPGQTGYVATYDPNWLAGLAASRFALWQKAAGETLELHVDGDSIKVQPANWSAVAVGLFQLSPLYELALQSTFGVIYADGRLTAYTPSSDGIPLP